MGDGVLANGSRAAPALRDVVFVSYSRADRRWVDRLLVLLTLLVRTQRIKRKWISWSAGQDRGGAAFGR